MPNTETGRLHRRLTLNSASNFARYVLSMGIAFFLTPYIVRSLGDSLYGFWILLLSFVGYASILEMGVQPAVVKLVGQYRAIGDMEKLRALVTAAFLFFLAVSVIAAVLVVTLAPGLVQRYIEDLQQLEHARWLFAAIALEAVVMYMNYLTTGILYGWQHYHLKNLIDAGGWILNAAVVLLLLPRFGLLAVVGAKLAMDVGILVASAIAVHRIFPEFRFRFGEVRRENFSELIGFGGQVFLSATTTRIATHAQPVIISTVLSSAATAFYAIPVKLIDYARQITWALTAGFMPAFSELESRQEKDTLREIYLSSTRFLFLALLPMGVLLFVFGGPFVGAWIGPEYQEKGQVVLWFLAGAVLLESFQPLLWRFFIGVGHLGVLVRVSAAVSLLTVVTSIVFVHLWGIDGVAASVFLGAVAAQGLYALYSCRYLEITPWDLFRTAHRRPLAVGAITFAAAWALAEAVGTDDLRRLGVCVVTSAGVYVVLAYTQALSVPERAWVVARARRALLARP